MDAVEDATRNPGRGQVLIGTSGWHYGPWWGPFYPPDLPKGDALPFYATRFPAVELNAPFYRTPSLEAVAGWAERSPDRFVFAWKASKFITHWKRLLPGSANNLALTEERLRLLGPKAGPVLFQLPPKMGRDLERLAAFLDLLPSGRRYAFEFRHPSWYEAATLNLLHSRGAALCLSDHAHAPAPWEATADFVYIRGHGPSGRYHGSYDDAALATWAGRIRAWQEGGRDVCCFFDNDIKAAAPADAARLAAMLRG